jgi:hypothetical protein
MASVTWSEAWIAKRPAAPMLGKNLKVYAHMKKHHDFCFL